MSRIPRVERAVKRALANRTSQDAMGHRDEKRSWRLQSLQRSVGNRAVGRLLTNDDGPGKVAVDPDPAQEREAERVAGQVRRTTRADDAASVTGRSRRPDTATTGGSGYGRSVDAGTARPLPPTERSFFERRFGHDFRDVRVHTGPEADAAARSINATAFTVGSDLVFSRGANRPATAGGRDLLAHELTHVVQQRHDGAALQRQEDSGSAGEESGLTPYRYLRRVEIEVSPAPVVLRSFEVLQAPGEPGISKQEFISRRIAAGDEVMRKAANDARVETLAGKSTESGEPSFSITPSEEIERDRVERTLKLYKQYKKLRDERFPDLDIPEPPGPTAAPKPDPEGRLYFQFDSTEFSELTTQADWEETVQQVVAYVRNFHQVKTLGIKPSYAKTVPVIAVHGYASPEGEAEYNQGLSDRRAGIIANRLAAALAAAGFEFTDYVVYGIGKGELEPELIIY